MGGWWGEYSFRCQPVDNSGSASATRVSSNSLNDGFRTHNKTEKTDNFIISFLHSFTQSQTHTLHTDMKKRFHPIKESTFDDFFIFGIWLLKLYKN